MIGNFTLVTNGVEILAPQKDGTNTTRTTLLF
jgi:hypothetical protein